MDFGPYYPQFWVLGPRGSIRLQGFGDLQSLWGLGFRIFWGRLRFGLWVGGSLTETKSWARLKVTVGVSTTPKQWNKTLSQPTPRPWYPDRLAASSIVCLKQNLTGRPNVIRF